MPFPITNQADLYYRNETPYPGQNAGNRVYPSEGRFAAQPYITRDIGQRWGFNVGFDDGLVRGGIVTLVDRAANDVVRLTKFSLDLPKGPLFLAKQFGLQLMNPRFFLNPLPVPAPPPRNNRQFDSNLGESRRSTSNDPLLGESSTLRLGFSDTQLYNPLSTIIQAGLTPLGLHFQRHSLPYVFPKYEELAKLSNGGGYISTNPELYNDIDLKPGRNNGNVEPTNTSNLSIETRRNSLNDPTKSKLVNLYANHILFDYEQNSILIEYPTGPGSMLGIGNTTIKRYDNTRKDAIRFIKNMVNNQIYVNPISFAGKPTFYNIEGINWYSSEAEELDQGKIIFTEPILARMTSENSVKFSTQSGSLNNTTSSKSIELNSFGKQSPILNTASSSLGFNFEQDEIDKTGNIQSRITLKNSVTSSLSTYSTGSTRSISVGEFAKRPTFDNIEGINFYSSDDEKNKTGDIQSRITLENSVTSSLSTYSTGSTRSINLESFGAKSPVLSLASSSLGSNFEQEEINKTGDIQSRITLESNTFNAVNTRFGTNAFTYDQLTSYTADTPKPGFKSTNNQTYRDFRQSTTPGLEGKVGFDNYEKMNIHTRVKVMDTGLPGSKFDEINAQDIGGSIPRDLVKFAFEPINNDTGGSEVITFRAYIKDFGDDYSAKWNSVDYMGRGEKFYTYEGFERKIKVSFTIFAHSVKEMKPLYRKLLYLFSQTAPDYSKSGYMRGPFVKLTIGNWFYRLPGFIGSISTTVDGKDTPWEITLNSPENGSDTGMLELPKLLEIDLDFTPIHDFTPQKGKSSSLTKFLNLKGWYGSGGGTASGSAATGSANTGGNTTGGTTTVTSTDNNGATINTNTVPTN